MSNKILIGVIILTLSAAAYAGWSDWWRFGKRKEVATERAPIQIEPNVRMEQRQIEQYPIQKQLEIRKEDNCKKELEYLEEQSKKYPHEKYYAFKLEKLHDRCETK